MSGPPPNLGPTRVILHVKGDVPDWKEEFKQFLLTVKDSEGYFRYRWGPWEEDHSKLEILATWAPVEHRQAFGRCPHHQKAIDALMPVLKAVPSKCPRVDFDVSTIVPPPPQLINSPICEIITITHFTGDKDAAAGMIKKVEANAGCLASHSGITATDTPDNGTVWLGFVGWQDYASSKAADKSVYIPSGVGKVESHHINFNFPIKGFSVTNPGR
ncbi:uncharacterized protein CLUP02_08718 [Colletotrichum lupini]|uniref:ABM domain-containing protein n=1 Tax=Colletotrichum lupini TaxID=145971 RepID=A0A9Q8STE0_9PEZI|nr:uncharacterized protein CLUP02_08718 [Colletotrichum lupini]KAK1710517.1 hypothetical protein BDP67DRAFT_595751 [Colletotrichum lupini]UQC83224.1 hypothetical protein CLUP02_08718 [Colletotrichum lupini]